MHLRPLDQFSTTLTWIAAVFIALRAGVEEWPAASKALPFVTDWHWLSFVPLALLLIAAGRQLLGAPSPVSAAEFKSTVDLAQTVIQASNALAASRPKPPDAGTPKTYVPDSFAQRYIAAINQRRTEIQIDALLRPHLNQWMRLEGRVEQTTKAFDGISVMLSDPAQEDMPEFWARFHMSWSTHLAHISKGEVVKVEVQIVDTGYRIDLMNAELL